ncbi:hypothetical protein [Paenibacillus borealis]|uniref:Copper amine oxidase-like N-terminal domain-containing protein n=1 Tax=Paenibacillus borealis TaxID=160799 RepID=A0A089LA11_PAEBO|nr:hypothetical protein [Paenibacillus borealis]AIQ57667.1 hypothetical protein PBOR_12560 [Paenibacillus borealis]
MIMIMTRKKWSGIIVIVAALILLWGATTQAIQAANEPISSDNMLMAVPYEENVSNVMVGEHGAVLLVDSIDDKEYTEMMSILYPNGTVDAQGQDIPGINNLAEVREQFIAEHMRAYSLVGEQTTEVKLSPFNISITDESNGEYSSLFYKASVGNDSFVFPSEWGNQSCGFISLSEKNIFIAYTDMGIWRIDPEKMSAEKLSSDEYSGKAQAEISSEITKLHPDAYLTWVDGVKISPDGNYVVYRTNRDSIELNETSIWEIDLNTGEESQLINPAYNNDIIGFINDSNVVVGALSDTRMIDVNSKRAVNIDVPKLPNLRISDVKNENIVFSSYEEGSSNTTAFISSVNVSTGKVSEITSLSGYLDGEPRFSPSGSKVAVGYGEDPMVGVDDVMFVDLSTKSHDLLSSSLQNARAVKGTNARFLWIDDDAVLVDTQHGSEHSSFLIKSQEE